MIHLKLDWRGRVDSFIFGNWRCWLSALKEERDWSPVKTGLNHRQNSLHCSQQHWVLTDKLTNRWFARVQRLVWIVFCLFSVTKDARFRCWSVSVEPWDTVYRQIKRAGAVVLKRFIFIWFRSLIIIHCIIPSQPEGTRLWCTFENK